MPEFKTRQELRWFKKVYLCLINQQKTNKMPWSKKHGAEIDTGLATNSIYTALCLTYLYNPSH